MTAQELRNTFLKYFESKNHKIIGSASLIPENDPTVLFTTAGMHPLVPYLMGEKHPEGERLVSVQKCVRTVDIEEVGDTTHHTFFEMLGNWSLGDYFKKEAIEYSWEFLTKILNLEKEKLAVSVFKGEGSVPKDEESAEIWKNIGIAESRIAYLGKKDNWWGPAGQTGPCGPDTEIFYWTGKENAPDIFDPEDDRWVEIWNDVLMQYNKTADNNFEALQQKNVDTGMGLERTLAVINGYDDNYLTELWQPIIKKIEELSGKKYNDDKKSFRVIADHIRSAVFIMGDARGIAPSNKDQGYVLRRLIRRAIRFAKKIGIKQEFAESLGGVIIRQYEDVYEELGHKYSFVVGELFKEELKFNELLIRVQNRENKRIEILKRILKGEKNPDDLKWIENDSKIANSDYAEKWKKDDWQNNKEGIKNLFITGVSATAHTLQTTYGYPTELVFDDIEENKMANDEELKMIKANTIESMKAHQELSRTASAGMFKGGLADDGEMSRKYHTATHLLHQALRQVLGNHVEQKGSNINEQRLRFDFTHPDQMTDQEKQKVEDIVNEQIKKALPVSFQEMSVDEAKQAGAIGLFEDKYGAKVKVYSMGNFSKEICGGPHVENTSQLGHFKIKKEQSSSAGIRRIKAVLE